MKLFMTICATLAILLLVAPSSQATEHQYGWTLSESLANPFVNTGAFAGGVVNLYLWYQCNTTDGMSAADMGIRADNPGNLVLGFNVMNGFLNAGTATDLLLAVAACPAGPVVAGAVLTLQNAPGEYCIELSNTGTNGTVDCDPAPALHNNSTTGYSNNGSPPTCDDRSPLLCNVISVDATSWGQVKGLYR